MAVRRIARLWIEGWQPLVDGLVVDLLDELGAGMTPGDAIVRGYLRQLAREPDTLIVRRHGADTAAAVSRRAGEVLSQGARGWRGAANVFDRELRSPKRINPGTTADLCATALYILLRDGRLRDRLGGSTDLAAGYVLALREVKRSLAQTKHTGATVLLVSDGHANHGITEPDRLKEVAAKALTDDIVTSTLGLGLGYDELLLDAITRGGNGNHRQSAHGHKRQRHLDKWRRYRLRVPQRRQRHPSTDSHRPIYCGSTGHHCGHCHR
jgi:hypothetical protein